jgi:hypothetical protein
VIFCSIYAALGGSIKWKGITYAASAGPRKASELPITGDLK